MRDSIQIRVLKNVGGYKADQLVRVPCDDRGKPMDVFWIRRLIEAKRDQCCEIVPEPEDNTPTGEDTTDAPEEPARQKTAARKRRNRSTT